MWRILDEIESAVSWIKAMTAANKLMVSPTCIIDPAGNPVRELPEFARDAKAHVALSRDGPDASV
jgi:hypothetical protein